MSYQLLSESTPKARKQHRCIWCGQSIEAGTVYRHERSMYDGNFQNHHWHLECDAAFSAEVAGYGEEAFDAMENERPKATK